MSLRRYPPPRVGAQSDWQQVRWSRPRVGYGRCSESTEQNSLPADSVACTRELTSTAIIILVGAFFETLTLGQLIRAHANRGLAAPLCYYRDHQSNEVDFLIPVGECAHLLDCKWAQDPQLGRGMRAVEHALGTGNVLSRSVFSSHLGAPVMRDGVALRSTIDFDWLLDGLS